MRKSFFAAAAVMFFLAGFSLHADTIAFFYALEKDLETLKAGTPPAGQPLKVGSRSIAALQLGSHRVYAVKMGSGAVETAASAQALLARVRCDAAFSTGPVGAISDSVKTGAWHRVTGIVCYQKGSWSKNGFQFSANAAISLTNNFATVTNPPPLFRDLKTITVASGEMFVAADSFRAQLRDLTAADVVDMNLFGLATVCADHQLPLTCWRVASDRADDHAGEDFRKFVSTYDGAGGKAVAEIIKNLPANPNSPDSYPNLKKLLSGQ